MIEDRRENRFGVFLVNRHGGVSIIFAALLIPLLLMIGSAIDYSRSLTAKTGLSNALDAAVLAGVNKLMRENGTESEVVDVVKATFQAGIEGSVAPTATVKAFTISQDSTRGEVSVAATVSVPTSFMAIAGLKSIDVATHSTARVADKDIELAMMLDLTGSMSGSKIADLKLAAKDLVDILLPDSGGKGVNEIRIGLVPYSQGVNAGPYAPTATDGVSVKCATERTIDNAANDKPYTTTPIGDGSTDCPNAEILPITDVKTELKNRIDGFGTAGWTAGHTGIAWAWYLLSPKWAALWPDGSDPAKYNDEKVQKIALLMTDGQFNTAYDYNAGKGAYDESKGNARTKSEGRAAKLCKNMKKKGIVIYSITFQLSGGSGKTMMQNCATDSTKYYDAADGAALRTAFRSIADDISELRISE